MEIQENFINTWHENISGEKSYDFIQYDLLKKEPSLISKFKFLFTDVQKQCFAIRTNPECYKYLPNHLKKQKSLISTLLTSQFSSSNEDYNLTGGFKLIDPILQKQIGYINLALLNHPYVYCSLSEDLKNNFIIIKKLMQGLRICALPLKEIHEIIKSIPIKSLKNHLCNKNNCNLFAEIMFEENNFESVAFWNVFKLSLMRDKDFINIFPDDNHIDLHKEIQIQKEAICNIYIAINFFSFEAIFKDKTKNLNKKQKI